jgi:phospholipid/cholesterol/gamma-HCH transport system substrate-binding protein
MKNTLETRLGIFVALAGIAAVLILELLGGLENIKPGIRVRALFDNVLELKPGDRVKMAGVDIGHVEDISITNNKVMVSMKLHKNAEVKTDSIATVKFTGLMGQNFVAVDFGTPGATLVDPYANAILQTKEQPDMGAIMQKIDNVASGVENLTKSFTGFRVDDLLGPFTDFLKANRGPLTATIANLQSISTQISLGKGTVGKLISDESLYNSALLTVSNLQDTADEIKLTIADARKVVDEANAGHGTLGMLLKDETLYKETTTAMTNLKEILQKVNQGQGSVGKLVNDQEFYRNAKLTLQKLDKATEGLEDQGPLSVLGIVVNNLF